MRDTERLLVDTTIVRAHALAVRDLLTLPTYVTPIPSALEVAAQAHRLGVVGSIDDVAARCAVLQLPLADAGVADARPQRHVVLREVPRES